MSSQNYLSTSHIIICGERFPIKSATAADVTVEGINFKVELMYSLMVGAKAKVMPAPVEGWDGVDSGFGSEFFYKIILPDGDIFYRKYVDDRLIQVGDAWKEGDQDPGVTLHLCVEPSSGCIRYAVQH